MSYPVYRIRVERSREALVLGSDYSKNPIPGQLALDLPSAGERSTFTPTMGCQRYGHHFNPESDCCNRCGTPRPDYR